MLSFAELSDERGGVLVILAVFLPVLLMFGTFVVDVGNWFEHKRHLQLQVDAGALAGGGLFAAPCSDAPIEQNARRYAGDPNPDPTSLYDPSTGFYNPQVTNPEDVHILINSTEFWNEGGTDFSDGGRPCQTRFVDVKATHDDLPWFFTVIPGADNLVDVNAHARVEIRGLDTVTGALPIAVNDVNPKSGAVLFVDETKSSTDATQILDQRPLRKVGASGGQTTWANDLDVAQVAITSRQIGVILAFSGATDADGDPIPVDTAGTLAEICGRPLIDCFDLTLAAGVLHIRGWGATTVGPNTPPDARDVWLNIAAADPTRPCANSLGNGEFFTNEAVCSSALEARIALGIDDPALFELVAYGAACPNAGCPLTYDAATQTWKGRFDVAPASGPVWLELRWQRRTGTIDLDGAGPSAAVVCTAEFRNNNPCSGSFGNVQRIWGAVDERSGPIVAARLSNYDGATATIGGPAHSYEIDPTVPRRLVVEATLTGNLETTTSLTSPPITLRVIGSQNGAIDCDPWQDPPRNFEDEIANGCRPGYTINTGTPCPQNTSSLWLDQPPAWKCVATQTGASIGQFVQGFNYRVHGTRINPSCVNPNRFTTQFPGFNDQEDSRIVQMFLTPFGSFSGSGNDIVPVRAFASFYITGWGGSNNRNADPCNPTEPIEKGFLKGYFIKFVKKLNDGGAGSALCNLNDFGTCVAVMTR